MGSKTLITVVGIIVLVGATLLVGPHLVNWNDYKTEIAEQITRATGRDIHISGSLNVRLLPTPALTVREVRLANLDGAEAPYMVNLEALEVRVALLPLLSGELQVERIRLLNPVINLERLADGRANWEFDSAPAGRAPAPGAATEASPVSGAEPTVRLDHFEIVGGTLIYRDGRSNTQQRIDDLNVTLRARSLAGPFEATGSLRYDEVPLSFETTIGNIIKGQAMPFSTVALIPGGTRLNVSGAVASVDENPRFRGSLEASGNDLGALLAALGKQTGLPALLGKPFTLTTDVDAAAAATTLNEVELSLGENRLSGKADFKTSDKIVFSIDLRGGKVDLDSLLQVARGSRKSIFGDGNTAVAAEPPSTNADSSAVNGGNFKVPTNISGHFNLKIDAVTLNKDLVKEVTLNASMADGVITINQAGATLPGVTEVSLQGAISAKNGTPALNGKTTAVISAPEALASWLGVIIPDSVAGRVRQISYRSDVALDAEKLTLSDITFNVDRSRISGGVTYALRDRPSFGASVQVDSLNLDSYMPAAKPATAAGAGGSQKPAGSKAQETSIQDIAGAWAVLRGLNAFDANVALRLGSLTKGGNLYRDLAFNATLYGGELKVREAKLGNYAGASASMTGTLNGFGGVPEMTGVSFTASAQDTATLGAALGSAMLPARLGPMKVSGKADGSILKPRIGAQLDIAGGSASLDGQMSLLPLSFGFKGTVAARHPQPMTLPALLGIDYRPRGPIGAMDVRASLETRGSSYVISAISGAVDGTTLAGALTVEAGAAAVAIQGELNVGQLFPEHFMAQPAPGARVSDLRTPVPKRPGVVLASAGSPPPADRQLAQAPGGSRVHARWSRSPISLAALDTLNADVKINAASIHYGDIQLQKAEVRAVAAGGVLTAQRFHGELAGGTVDATVTVRARPDASQGQSTLAGEIEAKNVDAARLVSDGSITQGRMNASSRFTTTGNSQAEWVGALDGSSEILLSQLVIKQRSKNNLLSGITGALSGIEGLLLNNPLFTGGQRKLASVDAALEIRGGRGTLTRGDLVLPSGGGKVTGTVDIAAWNLDLDAVVVAEANPLARALLQGVLNEVAQRHEFRTRIIGPLDDPKLSNTRYSAQNPGAPLQPAQPSLPAPSATGAPRPTPQPGPGEAPMQTPTQEPTPAQPQPVDPRQQRREAVEQLFKGLILGQ